MDFTNELNFYFFENEVSFDVVITGKTKEEVKEIDVLQMIISLATEHNLNSGEVVITSVISENGEWEDSDEFFFSYNKTTNAAIAA